MRRSAVDEGAIGPEEVVELLHIAQLGQLANRFSQLPPWNRSSNRKHDRKKERKNGSQANELAQEFQILSCVQGSCGKTCNQGREAHAQPNSQPDFPPTKLFFTRDRLDQRVNSLG